MTTYLLDDCPPRRPEFAPALDDETAGRWWVLHTKAQMEKRVVLQFLDLGLDFFLPLAERLTYSGGKRRITLFPLFGSYIFLRGGEHAPGLALGTQKLRQVIHVSNQAKLRADLVNLARALDVNPRIEQCDFAVAGRKVRVIEGPFEGVEGLIVKRTKGSVLVIEVESCGRATLEIDQARVEPAD